MFYAPFFAKTPVVSTYGCCVAGLYIAELEPENTMRQSDFPSHVFFLSIAFSIAIFCVFVHRISNRIFHRIFFALFVRRIFHRILFAFFSHFALAKKEKKTK